MFMFRPFFLLPPLREEAKNIFQRIESASRLTTADVVPKLQPENERLIGSMPFDK